MKTYNFPSKTFSAFSLIGLLSLLVTSCGSYQNSSYYERDGIYGQPENAERQPTATAQDYKDYFESLQEDDEVFTDVESYSSEQYQNEQDNAGHPSWGSDNDQVIVNVYDNNWGWNNWYGPGWGMGWGWNSWYGPGWGMGWGWNGYYGAGWGWGWNNWYGPNYGWGWNNHYYHNNYAYSRSRRSSYLDTGTRNSTLSRSSLGRNSSRSSYNTGVPVRRNFNSSTRNSSFSTRNSTRSNSNFNTRNTTRNSNVVPSRSNSRTYNPAPTRSNSTRNSTYSPSPTRSSSPSSGGRSGGSSGGGRSGGGGGRR